MGGGGGRGKGKGEGEEGEGGGSLHRSGGPRAEPRRAPVAGAAPTRDSRECRVVLQWCCRSTQRHGPDQQVGAFHVWIN